ncbi:agmatine deiminase [Leucobacter sp. Ag1]|uniref:agmatine deiminase family protein n=1 Tax=Leucobacter sp. Ag1 TaxID=1642040 RepID=UPI000621DF74|nr:agmatine deiminase family protein [Leucobacter sp. Ag1]KKI21495.1 agmatine deiminase [Leucobacter sp. Ag1]
MNLTRRGLLTAGGLTVLLGGLAGCAADPGKRERPSNETGGDDDRAWLMPEEGAAAHAATWMSFGVSDDIWGAELAPAARAALVAVANAIAAFEPVKVLVPSGTRPEGLHAGVELFERDVDDLWMRDTGPVFVTAADGAKALGGVDLNFNGWGDKQEHAADAKVASEVCELADVERIRTELVLEGGALEVDGEGTAIITESCVLNDNRNPGWTKREVEEELGRLFGIEKVIWLPGIAGKDITDGHTDFYARFTEPGVIVAARDDDPESYDYAVTRKHLEILKTATDAQGRSLVTHVLPAPTKLRDDYLNDDFAAGYINFYVCNGGVIAPEFGDAEADGFARKTLEGLFPGREVVQVNIDPIAAGGGGIHCATQQQLKS